MEGNGAERLKIHFRNSSTFCCGPSIHLHLLGGLFCRPLIDHFLHLSASEKKKTQSESWTEGVWFPSLCLWVTEWARRTRKYSRGELSLRLSARTVCGLVMWVRAVKHIETTYRVRWCVGPPRSLWKPTQLCTAPPASADSPASGFSSVTNTDANTSCIYNQL